MSDRIAHPGLTGTPAVVTPSGIQSGSPPAISSGMLGASAAGVPAAGTSGTGAPAETGTGTDAFARIAARCREGRDALVAGGAAPADGGQGNFGQAGTGQPGLGDPGSETPGGRLRRFSTWEVTRYLIPVATPHFRRVLKAHPALPQGISETEGGTRWFTLSEVNALREFFAREGSRTKTYRPPRPENLPARVLAVANFKGGVGKTATAAHLAMAAALDGYKVLAIDLDSQGSLSSLFGIRPDSEWETVFPLLARYYAESLQAENRARAGRGAAPLALDAMLSEALSIQAADIIRPTRWPSIDLLGAQLNLYWAEVQMPVWRMALPGWKLWEALSEALTRDGLLTRYDLVIIDTPPALGYLTINGLTAADILLVPLGASFLEFDSTGRFFDMLHATFASIEDSENRAARALGQPETRFEWDAVRALITRYDAAQQAEMARLIEGWMGGFVSRVRQDYTALIGQAGEQVKGIYEADYRDFNRETYIRGRETFDASWAEIRDLMLASWEREGREAAG